MSPHPPHDSASFPGDDDPDPADDAVWPVLFATASPREIMMRLLDGDPLELEPRSIQQLEERALLLAPARVKYRTLARIAYAARRYRGQQPLNAFLARRMRESVDELLEEDRQASSADEAEIDLTEPPYPRVAAILGIEQPLTLHACSAFNALPDSVRARCFPVLAQGKSIASCTRAGLGPPDEIVADLRTALNSISRRIGHTIEWPRNGPKGGADHGA